MKLHVIHISKNCYTNVSEHSTDEDDPDYTEPRRKREKKNEVVSDLLSVLDRTGASDRTSAFILNAVAKKISPENHRKLPFSKSSLHRHRQQNKQLLQKLLKRYLKRI